MQNSPQHFAFGEPTRAYPSHPEVPTVGAVAGGYWAAVTAQPLARLFKLSLSQVRAPGCPSAPKNTARPRFGVIPAQVRAAGGHPPGRVCRSPRGRSFDFTSEAAQRSSATDFSGFPFKIASSPPVPARRQQEGRCTDEKCRGPKFIFQRWQQSQ